MTPMVKMIRPTFSIITVCLNAENIIYETMNSVLCQTFSDYEYLIKDGQSNDHTMDIAQNLVGNHSNVQIIKSRDAGIYDAMNQAITSACGEYILFLNAGDTLHDNSVLDRVAQFLKANPADIVYGDIIEVDKQNRRYRAFRKRNSKLWYYALGACLCHQSMFCRRELFEDNLFDLSYMVCADRAWQMQLIYTGITIKPMFFCITDITIDGYSSRNVSILEKETRLCVQKYCGHFYIIYRFLTFIKRNIILRKILHWGERFISSK